MTQDGWPAQLAHERVVRDAWVACGNPAPTQPDPPGGLIRVEPRVFNAKTFHAFMVGAGHDNAVFEACRCSKKAAQVTVVAPEMPKCSRCGVEKLVEGSFGRRGCRKCDPELFRECFRCRSTRLECSC